MYLHLGGYSKAVIYHQSTCAGGEPHRAISLSRGRTSASKKGRLQLHFAVPSSLHKQGTAGHASACELIKPYKTLTNSLVTIADHFLGLDKKSYYSPPVQTTLLPSGQVFLDMVKLWVYGATIRRWLHLRGWSIPLQVLTVHICVYTQSMSQHWLGQRRMWGVSVSTPT